MINNLIDSYKLLFLLNIQKNENKSANAKLVKIKATATKAVLKHNNDNNDTIKKPCTIISATIKSGRSTREDQSKHGIINNTATDTDHKESSQSETGQRAALRNEANNRRASDTESAEQHRVFVVVLVDNHVVIGH